MTPPVDPHILELAQAKLSPKQYRAFELIHVYGMTIRGAAIYDREHRSTFVDRYDAACLNLERVGIYVNEAGQPYIQETA